MIDLVRFTRALTSYTTCLPGTNGGDRALRGQYFGAIGPSSNSRSTLTGLASGFFFGSNSSSFSHNELSSAISEVECSDSA